MFKELSIWICNRVNAVSSLPDLVLGTNVQVGFRAQDAPVRCHTILESGGAIPPGAFDMRDLVDYMLQVATRAETYQTARADAWAVYDAIDRTAGWKIAALVSGGQAYEAQTVEAMAAPQYLGQDEKLNHEFTTNFLFRMKKA